MSAGSALAAFVAVVAAVVAIAYFAAGVRVRRRATTPAAGGLVAELTEEVRRWRAEAQHWQQTAERLQRELDGRSAGG